MLSDEFSKDRHQVFCPCLYCAFFLLVHSLSMEERLHPPILPPPKQFKRTEMNVAQDHVYRAGGHDKVRRMKLGIS